RYEPHPYLAYAPVAATFPPLLARFWEGPDAPAKTPGTLRVICFGGSPVEEGWPAMLEHDLRAARPDLAIEVLNAGVASYTSAENLAALVFRGLDAAADVVVLEQGV